MKQTLLTLVGALALISQATAASYPDRFVWVFGWNLGHDSDVAQINSVLDSGAQHGCNGAMVCSV